MKIVVLDGYTLNPGDISWDGCKKLGNFACYDRTAAADIVSRIGDAEAILTNKTPITRETLDACPNLRYVGVLATGYNVVDIEAAKNKSVIVTNIPAYSTAAVAQHVFALLLEVCIHVGHHSETVFAGKWTRSPDFTYWDYPLIELAGKTMGFIGFGHTGQATAKIAVAMGMNALVYNRTVRKELETENLKFAPFEQVLNQADIVSIHIPLFDSTKNLINKDRIAQMKDGVIVINTARGPIVDETDMAAALKSGKVYYYAADVVSVEPILASNPLLQAPRCIFTPHIAWAPKETRQRCMDIAVANLQAFVKGAPINVVSK